MIALVTGEIGSGKTTVCQRTLDHLLRRGMQCMGILAPPCFDAAGVKCGIDVWDVTTGERRHLADRTDGGGSTIGEYSFVEMTLRWAVERLSAAIASHPDLLVVDEIGPLELVHRQGFVVALGALSEREIVPQALVVVRQAYVAMAEDLINRGDVCRFVVNPCSRDGLPGKLAAALYQSYAGTRGSQ
jgi:nucleoside-triphosphatase THEP1